MSRIIKPETANYFQIPKIEAVDIVLADCPWKYNSRANHKTRFRGGCHGHYSTMTLDDIKAMPVKDLAADDSMLFMWATFPMLQEALDVIKIWGFKYKTVAFTWTKLNPKAGTPFFGCGYYFKSNAEVCLLATKGKVIKPAVNNQSSIILAPRREHSRKPDESYERIDCAYPNLRKIELFSRQKRDGWLCYGNEVEKFIC